MTTELPTKRRRGGQPGNQNAKKNRGNKSHRRHRFAPGNRLGGAPRGNRNARRKRPSPHITLRQKFAHDPEAIAWIEANAVALDEAGFKEDYERDCALYDGWCGLTPEVLVGREYKFGLYQMTDADDVDGENLAA